MENYREETLRLARERSQDVARKFMEEVERLLNSGAVDQENYSRGILFGVVSQNIADSFVGDKERKSSEYRNLRRF